MAGVKVGDTAARKLNVVKQENEVEGVERKKAEFSRFNFTVSRGVNVWRVRRSNKVTVSRGLTILPSDQASLSTESSLFEALRKWSIP